MPPNKRRAPVWLMGLSNATFGLVGGFIVLPLPQMLAAEGLGAAKIAAVSAACLSPGFWVFLLSRMGGAVLSFAGATVCLLLPVFARWIKPLPLYLAIGTVGSLFTLGLLLLARTPTAFAVAFMAENVVQALSFTSAVAICLSTIGKDNPLAATQFSLLTSATVLPILYMGVLDGRAYAGLGGVSGLSGMYLWDGCLSLASCAVMGLAMWRWRGRSSLESVS